MGLFESACRPATDPADRDLTLSLPPPAPPRKKSTTHPKMSPHQTSPSPVLCPRDRSHSQTPTGRNHQESDSSKQGRASIPPPNPVAYPLNESGLPLTVPSPGTNRHTYTSSLPPAWGNLLSNISSKSYCFFLCTSIDRIR
jgi:hypothetical protein